jgi:hypothetical protein
MIEVVTAFAAPLIGMVGVIIGTVLNEYLRRGRRIEQYSSIIFTKRLEAYEVLMSLICEGTEFANEAISNASLSYDERRNLVSAAITPIAKHVDENRLYINGELGAHCTALFMGTEDIHDAGPPEKQSLLERYYKMLQETYRMITEDSGIAQINNLFHVINRPKITGPVIEAIRELRRGGTTKK